MDNKLKNFNPIIAIAALIQIIFIIVAIVSVKRIIDSNQPTLEVEVTGLTSEIEGLKEENQEVVEYAIYQAMSNNLPGENIKKSGVNIREDSLINRYYDKTNVHYANFIADIPEVSQSYQVAYVWSDDGLNKYVSPDVAIAVTCLDEKQLIYGEFDCNHDRDKLKYDIISTLIAATGGRPSADSDVVMIAENNAGYNNFKVKINYAVCDSMCICKKATDETKNTAIAEFEKFVAETGYNPSDIPHYFYNCDNNEMYLTEEGKLVRK